MCTQVRAWERVLRKYAVLLWFEIGQPCLRLCPLPIRICFLPNDQKTFHTFAKDKAVSENQSTSFRSQVLVVLSSSSLEAQRCPRKSTLFNERPILSAECN